MQFAFGRSHAQIGGLAGVCRVTWPPWSPLQGITALFAVAICAQVGSPFQSDPLTKPPATPLLAARPPLHDSTPEGLTTDALFKLRLSFSRRTPPDSQKPVCLSPISACILLNHAQSLNMLRFKSGNMRATFPLRKLMLADIRVSHLRPCPHGSYKSLGRPIGP
jgi:hypothetical protein